mgnify:CR=1 FL=1|jgi:hypothetical protein
MEKYQCGYCYRRLEPTEVITLDDAIACTKCALKRVIRPEPDNTCHRCSRSFYSYEIIEIDELALCVGCLCEELYSKLKDIEERLEAVESRLFKSL